MRRNLTPEDKAARREKLTKWWAEGVTTKAIGERLGLHISRVQQLVHEYGLQPRLPGWHAAPRSPGKNMSDRTAAQRKEHGHTPMIIVQTDHRGMSEEEARLIDEAIAAGRVTRLPMHLSLCIHIGRDGKRCTSAPKPGNVNCDRHSDQKSVRQSIAAAGVRALERYRAKKKRR